MELFISGLNVMFIVLSGPLYSKQEREFIYSNFIFDCLALIWDLPTLSIKGMH